MIACSVNQIGKMYGGNTVFENISFEIHDRDRIGLVGRNGSGKTTLFRMLAGSELPDSGQIHWKKGTEIGYLAQIPVYSNHITARGVLLSAFSSLTEIEKRMKELEEEMGMEPNPDQLEKLVEKYGDLQDQFILNGGYEMEANIERVANGLNISPLLEKPFGKLSGGEKTKVGLAFILLKQPDLLLLDEPTNHLDLMAVEWLSGYLKEYSGTIVVVSHDRYFLDEVVNKIYDLEDGEIHCYQTNFTGFVKEKEERLLIEFQAYEEQQKKIKKMKEAIKRLREWANRANPPNEGLHKRARNMERALERMEKLDRPQLNRKKMGLEIEASDRSGKDVVFMKNVSKSFGDQLLFQSVQMHITYRERVAIVGENGSGKSTLLKLILQELKADHGEVKVGSNVKIGYLSQQVFMEMKDETVIEAFRNEVQVTEGEARHILARFLFYGYQVFQKVSKLSGGERMRLRLAQLMYQEINLLILDEPTNHLDIESREVLEEVLEDFKGTILAVAHDRYFLNRLFDKIYWIERKAVYGFDGNYDWAREKIKNVQDIQLHPKVTEKMKSSPPLKEDNVHRKIDQLEEEIEKVEDRLSELDKQLNQESDLQKMQDLFHDMKQLEVRRNELYKQLELTE
ncbi:ribosomal protection-like ABC-F family protein [Bacillus sp. S/N-304-OC-R1]|uniref:ribosomal protection-like ABC-F family protein n=1 Tax=Bacillus sp. S/N-304-OC-R1 TaxID=2758034 RepID=UPI001C8E62D9|nr:ABC-F type ribosomal protection protein [Bacillus sp. S/N-304-OC-R1]MBY0123712.1 ABC-F type ribosomal protection protein [Bacillus sp. S/N-304-OC-R1]